MGRNEFYILDSVFFLKFQSGALLFQVVSNIGLNHFTFCFIVCFETVVISWIYGKSLALNTTIKVVVS